MTHETTIDRYCVMGNPIAHSRSPWIHTRFAELTGQCLRYDALLVAVDGLAQALADFGASGGRGCNITVPFKLQAAQLAHTQSSRVQLAGAANTLIWDAQGRIHADNTDGLGLVADITQGAGRAIRGARVLLIGAGGAAAGALAPLLEQRPAHIAIANRTPARAEELAQRHGALARELAVKLSAHTLDAIDGSFDIVINASASSLAGAAPPVAASVLAAGSLAYDMMYGPAAEGFLAWARAHGAKARDGLGMLVEQAAEAFALWRGVRPPTAAVLAALRQP